MSDIALNSLCLFGAVKLSIGALITLGIIGGLVIIACSFSYWRAAIKLALVVALLEGAIRKWVFPSGQELVYFLKDGLLLGAYLRVFLGEEREFRQLRMALPTNEIQFMALFICFCAFNPNFGSPVQGLFGIKMYFMYLPLVFVMPRLFRSEAEMVRQLSIFLWIALPICLLGFLQWRAGPNSPLNVYAWDVESGSIAHFGFGDKVRITGTFSYIAGFSVFLLYFIGLSLVLLSERKTWQPWLIVLVLLPVLLGNALMNGSRGLIIMAIIVFGVFAMAGFSGQIGMGTKFRTFLMMGVTVGFLAITYLFVDSFFYLTNRFTRSNDTVQGRATTWHLRHLEEGIEKAGPFGYGLGISFPSSSSLASALKLPPPRERPPIMESEPGQIWLETGPLGFFSWFGIRGILIWSCLTAYRRARTPLQRSIALLAMTIGTLYLLGHVVGSHTSNILLHALTGLALVPMLESTAPMPRRAAALANGRLVRQPNPHAVHPAALKPPHQP